MLGAERGRSDVAADGARLWRSWDGGALTRVTVDASGTPIVAAVTARSVRELNLVVGAEVVAGFKATAVHLC